MKSTPCSLLLLLGLLINPLTLPSAETWDTLAIGGNTLTNVTVAHASPMEVIFKHQDGYLRINRQELPGDLKIKYPYDAPRAEVFQKQQSQNKQGEALIARERLARRQIQVLEQQQEAIRTTMRTVRGKKGTPDRGKMDNHRAQIEKLEKQKIPFQSEIDLVIQEQIRLQQEIRDTPPLPGEPNAAAVAPTSAPSAEKSAKKKKKKK